MYRLLIVLLAACSPMDSQAPPPPDFSLAIGTASPGSHSVWHIADGVPNAWAYLVVSKGILGAGDCPAALNGACFDITAGASGYRLLDRVWVGSDGRAAKRILLPAHYQPRGQWAVQAVMFAGGVSLSNPDELPVHSGGCADDGFEDNDDQATAIPLEFEHTTDLKLCDHDAWSVELAPGEALRATMRYSALNVRPYFRVELGWRSELLTDGLGFDEIAMLNDGPTPQTAYIFITPDDHGDDPWYQLTARRFMPAACVPDAYEDDDVLFDATRLGMDQRAEAVACDNDPDTFAFDAQNGDDLRVRFDLPDEEGILSAELLDPAGTVIQRLDPVRNGSEFDEEVTTDGVHFVVVRQEEDDIDGGGIPYALTRIAAEVDCEEDVWEPNDVAAAAPTLAPLTYEGMAICQDEIDLFRVDLRAGQTLVADVRFDHLLGDIDVRLLDETGAAVASAGSTSDNERVSYTAPADMAVWLDVYLFAHANWRSIGTNYALSLSLGAPGTVGSCGHVGDRDADGICDDADLCLGEDASGDADGDGLCDAFEVLLGSHIDDVDSDDDGRSDGMEIDEGTHPARVDSNEDGVCDGDRADNDTDGLDPADPCVDPGPWTTVELGSRVGCALREGGLLSCWGSSSWALDDPPVGVYSDVALGSSHACALDLSGQILCWGDPSEGRLDAPSGTFVSLDAGGNHTCAIEAGTDAVMCWGGLFTSPAPQGSYSQVAGGASHTCALRNSGTIRCWGHNDRGQTSSPSGVYDTIDAGTFHTCVLDAAGLTQCWGVDDGSSFDWGQVTNTPTTPMSSVAAGSTHNCGLTLAGDLECWGDDRQGQATPPSGSFVHVACSLSSSPANSCAIDTQGAILCWGADYDGQSSPPPP